MPVSEPGEREERLALIHVAQVITYLKATSCALGMLINVNVPTLKGGIRRVVLSDTKIQE
jgi:GxxExxY protein